MLGKRSVTGSCRRSRPSRSGAWDELGFKATLPVAGNLDRQFAEAPFQRLPAFAVAGVAGRIGDRLMLGVAEVLGHVRFQRTLHRHLGEPL